MGIYINPPDKSKEEFLHEHGRPVGQPLRDLAHFDFTSGFLPVVWVHNGDFTAAAIAYNQQEVDRFLNSAMNGDPRPMAWYLLPKKVLQPFFAEHDMIV